MLFNHIINILCGFNLISLVPNKCVVRYLVRFLNKKLSVPHLCPTFLYGERYLDKSAIIVHRTASQCNSASQCMALHHTGRRQLRPDRRNCSSAINQLQALRLFQLISLNHLISPTQTNQCLFNMIITCIVFYRPS